MGIRGIENS